MTTCPHCGLVHGAKNHFCPVKGRPIELGPRLVSESLLDRYRVITVMGEGSVGIVLDVEDRKDRSQYTAKLIHPQFTRNCLGAESYFADVRAVQTLNSPHVAKVVAAGKDSGAAFVVVRQQLKGRSLRERLMGEGQLPSAEAVRLAIQILIAIEDLGSAGVAAVDFSLGDVFLVPQDGGENVKLLDVGEHHFKLAIPIGTIDLESQNYRAPELQKGADIRGICEGAGVYAVGAMLYEMLTGVVPESTSARADSIVPGLPRQLVAVISKSLAADPRDRFLSAEAFREELAASLGALEDEPDTIPGALEDEPDTIPGALEDESDTIPGAFEDEPDTVPDEPPRPSAPPRAVDDSTMSPQPTPSVIVDMPEIEGQSSRPTKALWFAVVTAMAIAALGGLAMWEFGSGEQSVPEPLEPEKIEIQVKTVPPDAAVSFDGKRIEGRPAVIEAFPDGRLHTISAKAEGFETLEKNLALKKNQTVTLELIEIVRPEPKGSAPSERDEDLDADIGQDTGDDTSGSALQKDRKGELETKAQVGATKTEAKKKHSAPKAKRIIPPKAKKQGKRKRPAKTRDGFSKVNPFD